MHSRSMRVRQLGSKTTGRNSKTARFAVLMPGISSEHALTERPDMLDTALKAGDPPPPLIALLKTVTFGWRQPPLPKDAATIHEMGQSCIVVWFFVRHLELGQQLMGAGFSPRWAHRAAGAPQAPS
jgi:hypothetical protein